jgi:predicted AAA+ superfamily ATPase
MLEIAKSEIVARLCFDNSWWESGRAGKVRYQDMPKRKYFQSFYRAGTDVSVNRAVVLMGPRRVGKTAMVLHAIRTLLDSLIDLNRMNTVYFA